MKNKKILFLTRLFYPHVGGVERHIEFLNKELVKSGHEITVLSGAHKKYLKKEETYKGVQIIRLRYPVLKFVGLLVIWFEMLKNIKHFIRADIIHIHDVFIWYLPLRILYPRKHIYMTFHGYPDYPIPKVAIYFQKIAQRFTSGNISVGDFIPKWFGTKADIITYGAVDTSKFKPVRKKKFKYDAVFASRLDEQTGILAYLDAIKVLKRKGVDFNLVVLGEGKYFKEARKLTVTKGFVKDPSKYFSDSKYAFVNRYLGILEAFVSKKLVFAVYDNPIKKDYLLMTPYKDWLVIEKSPKKLAERIVYYMEHPKKTQFMIESAYNWAKTCTWRKMADNYEKLWGMR